MRKSAIRALNSSERARLDDYDSSVDSSWDTHSLDNEDELAQDLHDDEDDRSVVYSDDEESNSFSSSRVGYAGAFSSHAYVAPPPYSSSRPVAHSSSLDSDEMLALVAQIDSAVEQRQASTAVASTKPPQSTDVSTTSTKHTNVSASTQDDEIEIISKKSNSAVATEKDETEASTVATTTTTTTTTTTKSTKTAHIDLSKIDKSKLDPDALIAYELQQAEQARAEHARMADELSRLAAEKLQTEDEKMEMERKLKQLEANHV